MELKIIKEVMLKDFNNQEKGDYQAFDGLASVNGVKIPYTRHLTITDKDECNNLYFTDYISIEEKFDKYFDDLDMYFNS